eukprot:2216830-Rhodomonas_salina.1
MEGEATREAMRLSALRGQTPHACRQAVQAQHLHRQGGLWHLVVLGFRLTSPDLSAGPPA